MVATHRSARRERRGAPWTEEEEERLLDVAHLPPKVIADLMRRSWLACRRRLSYLRANGNRAAEYPARADTSRWPNRRSPVSTPDGKPGETTIASSPAAVIPGR